MNRCKWCNLDNLLYVKYHDEEWGVLNTSDAYLFEMLILELFQAGLSFECVLNKREYFKEAYDNFDIRKIILYDMPSSIEDFMQQTGRASRDGKYAEAILLFSINDINTINFFIEKITDKVVKKDRYDKLHKMVSLCLSKKCIHKVTCEYFGVKYKKKNCMMCSNCKK